MTPDEARALLDGTTPAEDWWYSVKGGWVRHLEPVGIDAAGELDVSEDDAALIVAAPALAALAAGMREEWGVSCGGEKPGAWWASHKEADQCAKRMRICIHYPLPIVVVRRYVTEPEAADATD